MRSRLAFLLPLLVLSTAANAGDGLFGTKTSPASAPLAGSNAGPGAMGAMPLAQMFVALLIVLALLKWLLPAILKRATSKAGISTSGINVKETAVIGAANLYVVEVRGKSFLVGATTGNVSLLADLTSAASTLKPLDQPEELPTFQELVDSSPGRNPYADASISDALEQLNRLKRLS